MTVLGTTLAVVSAAATTGTTIDSAVVSGANVTLGLAASVGAGASAGRALCTVALTLSGNGSLSTNSLGFVNVDRTDLSLLRGSLPIASFID